MVIQGILVQEFLGIRVIQVPVSQDIVATLGVVSVDTQVILVQGFPAIRATAEVVSAGTAVILGLVSQATVAIVGVALVGTAGILAQAFQVTVGTLVQASRATVATVASAVGLDTVDTLESQVGLGILVTAGAGLADIPVTQVIRQQIVVIQDIPVLGFLVIQATAVLARVVTQDIRESLDGQGTLAIVVVVATRDILGQVGIADILDCLVTQVILGRGFPATVDTVGKFGRGQSLSKVLHQVRTLHLLSRRWQEQSRKSLL